LYYLPIKSKFVENQNTFDQTILNYVGTCSRNR
jgi:tetraacyldisaccharide 4'-kinase